MKAKILAIFFFTLCFSSIAFGQQAKLEGHVYQILNGKELPIAAVQVKAPGGQGQATDAKGHFALSFPSTVQAGQATRIEIEKEGWVIYEPMFGNCVTQNSARNYEPLKVILVEKRSPLALTPKRLSQVIARWSSERTQLRGQVKEQQRELDEYAFLREYAEKYGFTLEQFKQAADKWALSKDSDDKEEQALKEYWRKNYDNAARLAHEAAIGTDDELDRLNQERLEVGRKSIRRFQLEGNAFYEQSKFREAIAAYAEIENRFAQRKIVKEDLPEEWAETKGLIGNAKSKLGDSVEGRESQQLLGEAVSAYRAALEVRTREQLPQDWAMTQNNLGVALSSQGERSEGAAGTRLLGEAVSAYRAALEVYTREQLPQQWAATQNNLGVALRSQGERSEGAAGTRLLGEAVSAYRAALEVRTRGQLPQQWAMTQNNLAKVYILLKQWQEAAGSYANVLTLYPNYEAGYQALASIYHERVFEYEKAFGLHRKWLAQFPQETSVLPDFAETHFTTERFTEFSERIKPLLADAELSASAKIALHMIEVANLLALDKAAHVPNALTVISKSIAEQKADFQIGWSFSGTLHFINQKERFVRYRAWLNQFFGIAQGENRVCPTRLTGFSPNS